MTAVLLDTDVWTRSLNDDTRLSAPARAAIEQADTVLLSPISFFEIAQKVRLNKWPEMAAFVDRLPALLRQQGGGLAPLSAEICIAAGSMDWAHRDPFDRFLAATARRTALPLVSADTVFDAVITRVW